MAESEQNKKKTSNLADELDAMLDETESSKDQANELIDDEDAIDRLLMDNAFEASEEDNDDEFADIDELINDSWGEDHESEMDGMLDEFADEVIDAGAAQADLEIDEFADDNFVEQEQSEPVTEVSNGDVMDDVDEFAGVQDENEEAMSVAELSIAEDEFDQVDEQMSEIDAAVPEFVEETGAVVAVDTPDEVVDLVEFRELKEQLTRLQHTQDALEQQLALLKDNHAIVKMQDDLDALYDSDKKQQRRLAQIEQRKPTMVYVALATAIIALLVGGGLGIVGYGADAKTASLQETVISLEEQLDAWIAKQTGGSELQAVTTRLDQMDIELGGFTTKLEALRQQQKSAAQESWSDQIKQLSDQVMQTAAVVEALQLKVNKLTSQKQASSKKTKVVNKNWVVNLVSFKQEWYAKRKASEYQKQGIPVDISGASVKGEKWYRLRVSGFKSQYEAAAYAAKVKKTLNLTSVWVTKE